MLNLKVVPTDSHQTHQEYAHLQRRDAIEQGRANAIDLLIKDRPLHEVLTQITCSLEAASEDIKCTILLANSNNLSLSPIVGPSLPIFFLDALKNIEIGPDAISCGASAYWKKPIFIEDISKHSSWQALRFVATEAGVNACWSYPIISPKGETFGTFVIFCTRAREASQDDIDSLEYEAKIVSIIVERAKNIEQLKLNNSKLEKRVDERTRELSDSNFLLKKALEQRNEVQTQLIEMENMAALGTMMSSLTHEINTPVGVAITAISHLRTMQLKSFQMFKNNLLKRSDLEAFYQECAESSEIVERNLLRSTELIKTFKQLSVDQHSQDARALNLCDYVCEVLLSLKPRLKRAQHTFCIDIDPAMEIISNPGAISQLLINLIMNSAIHGFPNQPKGRMLIKARTTLNKEGKSELLLEYRDNGVGMSPHMIENIYKPFFTSARGAGGSGLGMHICYNIVVKVLRGSIDCLSEPGKGVQFTLRFPLNESCNSL
jgi:signal transduction histidine kinase